MRLTLTVDNQAQFDGAFDVLTESLSDLRPVWPEIELQFYRAELEQFNSEGARGGARWQALSPKYARRKAKLAPGKPILELTGRLKRSLTVIGGADAVRIAEPLSLTLGTKTPYAGFHQRGGRKLPQRKPLNLTRDDYGKFVSRIYRYAESVGREAGFQVSGKRN